MKNNKLKTDKKIENINKRKKAILFFSFYAIFFMLFILIFNNIGINMNPIKEKEIEKKENNNYSIQKILDNNIKPIIKITNNNQEIEYSEEYKYNELLKIENINQLIKKSKFISNEKNENIKTLNYELNSKELKIIINDDINSEEIIKIILSVNNNDVTNIKIDLSKYLEIDNYTINLNYEV